MDKLPTPVFLGFPCGSAGKESACNVGDLDSIPGLGRSSGEGKVYLLQYSGLENSMDCPWGCKESDMTEQVSLEWYSGFPHFLQFKSEFGNKELMIWVTVSSWSCFRWLYRASPSSAAKNIVNLTLVLTIWWCPCVESSLVLLEEDVCYDQCVLLEKLC